MIYSLGYENAISFIQYFSYLYSTFSLIVVIFNTKRFYLFIKDKIINAKLYKKIKESLYSNKHIKRYFEDIKYKNMANLIFSAIVNFIFISLKFIGGITNKSVWVISLAIYYFLLIAIKIILLNNLRRYSVEKEYNIYRIVGYFIFVINIALVIMIIQMISSNVIVKYNEYLVYLTAIYTFYLIINAIVNVISYRKYKNPILSSIKIIDLLTSSVAILMLQTIMIATFGNGDTNYMQLMNTITGSSIAAITLILSIYMIIKGQKKY